MFAAFRVIVAQIYTLSKPFPKSTSKKLAIVNREPSEEPL